MNKSLVLAILLSLLCYCCQEKPVSFQYVTSPVEDDTYRSVNSPSIHKKSLIQKFSDNAKVARFMDERRIYIVDLTRSMGGFNGSDTIFGEVKNQLCSTIEAMNDTSSEVMIVPFTDHPLGLFKETISHKDSILNYINNLETKLGDTNILDAWRAGEELLDSTKINYMFMLTDGVHNYGEPIDSLYQTLKKWHIKTQGKYQFAFYVLLTQDARENELCRIVDSSKQMWLVPSMNIQTDFIVGNMNLSVNIINSNKVKLHLSCTNPEIFNQGFRFKISIPENDFYRITNASEYLDENGNLIFEIQKMKPQKELPISYKTVITVDYDKEKYPFIFFTPEEYKLNIVNIGTRIINIKKLEQ